MQFTSQLGGYLASNEIPNLGTFVGRKFRRAIDRGGNQFAIEGLGRLRVRDGCWDVSAKPITLGCPKLLVVTV